MLILADSKMPDAAKCKLSAYGDILEFSTEGITYDAISGHPDIFFCPTPAGLIVAPNLPEKYFSILQQNHIHYIVGELPVGRTYPASARYNTLVTETYIITHPEICDPSIHRLNTGLQLIGVKQGYIRCNLLALPGGAFITSDRGIEKSLLQQHLEVLFVDPSCVRLDGFEHGFFGGACGLYGNTLFLCGSLSYFNDSVNIEAFVSRSGIQIFELYEGQPVDVGTILCL